MRKAKKMSNKHKVPTLGKEVKEKFRHNIKKLEVELANKL